MKEKIPVVEVIIFGIVVVLFAVFLYDWKMFLLALGFLALAYGMSLHLGKQEKDKIVLSLRNESRDLVKRLGALEQEIKQKDSIINQLQNDIKLAEEALEQK